MKFKLLISALVIILFHSNIAQAQLITSPKEHFGFDMGEQYHIPNYTQTDSYFKKLSRESERVKLVDIGNTEEGRRQYMLVVSSPANIKKLRYYKEISQKMARAEEVNEVSALNFAKAGKSIVWIDGGGHSVEYASNIQLIETAWQLTSRTDEETLMILDNVIILLVNSNPDGQELVGNWYMRESDPPKRSLSDLPRLYQKYAGHDNNRDFYMLNLAESRNISKQLYIEWLPQIVYSHHQSASAGSIVAGPPYDEPFNHVYDPLVISGIQAIGAAMQNRLFAEGKSGYSSGEFSSWYNGSLRTTAYFHNIIGILTEIVGRPYKTSIPAIPSRLTPKDAWPNPVRPQQWPFNKTIDYSVALNYAVLDYAARNRDKLLYNIYRMGKNSIEKGSMDYWSLTPSKADSLERYLRYTQKATGVSMQNGTINDYNVLMKDSSLRDPRAYILSCDQPDFASATKFINNLIQCGVIVHKADHEFIVGGKMYRTGSYIVKTNQAFRPFILDMFEPQDYPKIREYANGPVKLPYDLAGWTLAFQMGIKFDRVWDEFDNSFYRIPYGEIQPYLSPTTKEANYKSGIFLSPANNNTYCFLNELRDQNLKIYRVLNSSEEIMQGSFYIQYPIKNKSIIEKFIKEYGIQPISAQKTIPNLRRVRPLRIALADIYGESIKSGWARFILDSFKFEYDVIYNSQNRDTTYNINQYDVLLIVSRSNVPYEHLKSFVKKGGTLIIVGEIYGLIQLFNIPIKISEILATPDSLFNIPGSVLQMKLDPNHPITWGMPAFCDIVFEKRFSLAFSIIDSSDVNLKPFAWFKSDKLLRSGLAIGEEFLNNSVAAFTYQYGNGKVVAFGPDILFRGQTHGAFKLIFNNFY